MKLKPEDYDIADHFKGTFHKEEKKKLLGNDIFEWFCPIKSVIMEEFKKVYRDALIYGTSVIKVDSDGTIENVTLDPGLQVFFDEELGALEVECVHEPIDVGFVKPKIVCKKCDKEIK